MPRFLLITILFLLAFCPLKAELETGGAFRQIIQWQKWPEQFEKNGLIPYSTNQIHQSLLRLWLNKDLGAVRFKFGMEFNSLYQSMKTSSNNFGGWGPVGTGNSMTKWKADSLIFNTPGTRVTSNIERFEFSFSHGDYDFQIGRQPISLGTSHFLSVLDVIAPFYPGYMDSSYKPGVDAIRVRTTAGETGEMELIAVAGTNPSHNALFGRFRDTFYEFDIELLGGRFRDRNFFGLGWEGESRKINYWGEFGIFERKSSLDPHLGGPFKNYAVSWIAGAEKDLGKDYRGGIAYMHQDFGARETKDLGRAYQSSAFQQGWSFLGASEYSLLTITREMNPLTNLSLNGIFNMVDGSIRYQPTLSISTGDNTDISLFAWISTGKSTELSNPNIIQKSEFGSSPNGGGIVARYFF